MRSKNFSTWRKSHCSIYPTWLRFVGRIFFVPSKDCTLTVQSQCVNWWVLHCSGCGGALPCTQPIKFSSHVMGNAAVGKISAHGFCFVPNLVPNTQPATYNCKKGFYCNRWTTVGMKYLPLLFQITYFHFLAGEGYSEQWAWQLSLIYIVFICINQVYAQKGSTFIKKKSSTIWSKFPSWGIHSSHKELLDSPSESGNLTHMWI